MKLHCAQTFALLSLPFGGIGHRRGVVNYDENLQLQRWNCVGYRVRGTRWHSKLLFTASGTIFIVLLFWVWVSLFFQISGEVGDLKRNVASNNHSEMKAYLREIRFQRRYTHRKLALTPNKNISAAPHKSSLRLNMFPQIFNLYFFFRKNKKSSRAFSSFFRFCRSVEGSGPIGGHSW